MLFARRRLLKSNLLNWILGAAFFTAVGLAQTGIITTYLGSEWVPPAGPAPAVSTAVGAVYGVAADAAGNFYFATIDDNRVYKVDSKGTLTMIAGTTSGYAGDGGPATSASFNSIRGLAADAAGNIYVDDSGNFRIRKIALDGTVSTVAGIGIVGFSGDGGPAVNAQISSLTHINVDPSGNLYLSDTGNYRVRMVRKDGTIVTVAGNGNAAFAGDGGSALSASLNLPQGVAADAAGNVYIADAGNQRIRRVTPSGVISTIAGTGTAGFSGDGGPATSAQLSTPRSPTVAADGSIYFVDSINYRIRKIDPKGVITTVAGDGTPNFAGDGGPAASAQITVALYTVLDSGGRLLFNEIRNGRVRAISPNGTISTVAGNGNARYSGDGGPSSNAVSYTTPGLARDAAGNLYVSDATAYRVRKISPFGIVSTYAGSDFYGVSGDGGPATKAGFAFPTALAFDSTGNLYIVDSGNNKVRRVSTNGTITTFAGNGGTSGLGDGGPAANATLVFGASDRNGIVFDAAGNAYISTTGNGQNRIRKVTPAGAISTFAGNGNAGFSGDGGPATSATLNQPSGLAFDATGNLYIADSGNHRIRKVTPGGAISTVAGNGTAGYSGDGGQATSASLSLPGGVLADPSGALYIADTGNNVVRRIDSKGVISTVAGNGIAGSIGDGRAATSAELNSPIGLNLDAAGNLYIAENGSGRVRLVRNGAAPQLALSQAGLTLTALAGGGVTLPQTVTVLNSGGSGLPWTATASTTSGGSGWLTIAPAQGISTTASPQGIVVSANPAGLAPGAYYGLVQVSAPGVANSPQFATVVLNVLGAEAQSGPNVQPTGLVFAGAPGGSDPAAQKVSISAPGATTVNFTATVTYAQGANWLTLQPAGGSVSPGQAGGFSVQPKLAGLAAGVYAATINVAFAGGGSQRLDVLLVVNTGIPPTTATTARSAALAGCAPSKLLPTFTLLGASFTATAGWPIALQAKILDDCGQPMTAGSVSASFSNSDPVVTFTALGDGRWDGTWSARSATNVTINLSAKSGALTGSAQITGNLSANPDPPLVATGGLLNAASYALQSPVAPGTMVSIFGTHLSQSQGAADALPLALRMNGTTATVAGVPLPLLYTSDGQVNAMMPYGLASDVTLQLIMQRGNSLSLPEPVRIAPAEPAIFTKDLSGSGQGIVLGVNADGSQYFAQPGSPASAGAVLVIYAAGLGSVDPPLTAGAPAPLSPLSATTNPVTVTIGGKQATVLFAGLTPGFAGLYQVNAVVPDGVAPGDAVPIVLGLNGQTSPATVTIAVR